MFVFLGGLFFVLILFFYFVFSDAGLGHQETMDVAKLRIPLNLNKSRTGVWAKQKKVEGQLSGFLNVSFGQVISKLFAHVRH